MNDEDEIRATARRVIAALTSEPTAPAELLLDSMIHSLHALMLTLIEDAPELITPGLAAIRDTCDRIESDRTQALN